MPCQDLSRSISSTGLGISAPSGRSLRLPTEYPRQQPATLLSFTSVFVHFRFVGGEEFPDKWRISEKLLDRFVIRGREAENHSHSFQFVSCSAKPSPRRSFLYFHRLVVEATYEVASHLLTGEVS